MSATNGFFTTPEADLFLDTAVPNTARIFNYLLGGTANFETDRQAADKLLQTIPSLQKWVRLRRAFIQEAAQTLHNQGFTQFLDLGAGIPTENHLHASIPTARIIYCDANPVAVSYGQSLFAEFINIDYIHGSVKQVEQILHAPAVRRLIALKEKVAIGLNALPLFLTEAQNHQLAAALFNWAPIASQIFVVFQTHAAPTATEQHQRLLEFSAAAGLPIQLYTLDQHVNMMAPWKVNHLHPLTRFLGLPDDFITDADRAGVGVEFYAAFLIKETA